MLGQDLPYSGFLEEYEAELLSRERSRSIADVVRQPYEAPAISAGSVNDGSGLWEAVKSAAGSVVAVIEKPFQAVGGVLTGVQRTGEYLPWILFGLGAVALITFLPKGGVYHVAPRRRK